MVIIHLKYFLVEKNSEEGNLFLQQIKIKLVIGKTIRTMMTSVTPDTTSFYNCDNCDARYKNKKHLNVHVRKKHSGTGATQGAQSKKTMCPVCWTAIDDNLFSVHLSSVHEITLEIENMEFSSLTDFVQWKDFVEKETLSKYILKRGAYTYNDCRTHYFICFRSGYFKSDSKGYIKTQGCCKINTLCPASMIVKEELDSGKCAVTFKKTHLHDNDVGLLNLNGIERQQLAAKLALEVPFDSILDDVRDSISTGKSEGVHLLTEKDLQNIKNVFNVDALVSIDTWIDEIKEDCVLLYKPQGALCENYPQLKQEDFVLVIMNKPQYELLQTFGSDTVCLDSILSPNSYGFQLTALIVIDDLRQGFPCCFLISNRTDQEIMSVFFSEIKKSIGLLSPKVLMTDMTENSFTAWTLVMNVPDLRLFCAWDIDRNWRNNLEKIEGKEKQVHAYKLLRVLQDEINVDVFLYVMSEAHKKWLEDGETHAFAMYFSQFFLGSSTSWAYCYRQHLGPNTNINIERIHETLKHIYLQGNKVDVLNKTIHAIMQFVRDKLVVNLNYLSRENITEKLNELNNRHKTSESTFSDSIISKEDEKWNVLLSDGSEIHVVDEVKKGCPCQIVCTECESCIHQYSCTCIDSSIKWNMCNHIHSVCKFRQLYENVKSKPKDNIEKNENPVTMEVDPIPETLNNLTDEERESLEKDKNDMKTSLLKILNSISTIEEAKVVKNIIATMEPALLALRSCRQIEVESSSNLKRGRKRGLFSSRKIKSFKRSLIETNTDKSIKKKKKNKKNKKDSEE